MFLRYRGFDGVSRPVPDYPKLRIDDGLADVGDLALVDEYVATSPTKNELEVILIARGSNPNANIAARWQFYGFDVGYFESEWSHFSVVLNEIVYGTRDELRQFVGVLNANLLVPSLDRAYTVRKEHERLLKTGADVEQCPCIEAISIYGRIGAMA